MLANCVINYNACILSQLLDYAERKQDFKLADRIKSISPVIDAEIFRLRISLIAESGICNTSCS